MTAAAGWSAYMSINTPLISCCSNEMSNFFLAEFIINAGVAYSNQQLGALNRYFQLKYNFPGVWTSVVGLGYARTDVMPVGGGGGALRIGTNGVGGDNFAGAIQDVRAWSRTLTNGEVAALAAPPLAFPNAVNPAYSAGATSYSWTCAAGAFGAAATATLTAGSWSFGAGGAPKCQLCAPGTWSAAGAVSCTGSPCAAGSTAPYGAVSSAAAACSQCPAGSFAPTAGLAACSPCPAGTYSLGTGNNACTACAAGTWSSGTGQGLAATCVQCGLGTYSTAVGATSAATCTACAPGTASATLGAGLASTCASCLAGWYNNLSGQATCMQCPQNSYSSSAGATSCTQCSPGSSSSAVGANTPATCVFCSAGSYSVVNAGTSSCVPCPPGTYSLVAGSSSCTQCLAGFYSTATGASSAATCVACAPGTFNPSAGSGSACTPCFAGTYQAASGSPSCTACGQGTSSTTTGASSAASCVACAAGSYAAAGSNGGCLPCAAGSFAASTNSASCTLCNIGTYLAATGATSSAQCVSCPPGSASGATGAAACTQCAPGTYASGSGATACSGTQCAAGFFGPANATSAAQATCSACPINFYSPYTGSTACTPCPSGTNAPTTGSAACSSPINALYNTLTSYFAQPWAAPLATGAATANLLTAANQATSLWSASPIDTRVSWTAKFTLGPVTSANLDGMSFGVHADSRLKSATGAVGAASGIFGAAPVVAVSPWAGVAIGGSPLGLFAGTSTQPVVRTSVGAAASSLAVTVSYDSCLMQLSVAALSSGTGYSPYAVSVPISNGLATALGSSSGFLGFTAGDGATAAVYPVSAYSVSVALPSCAAGSYAYGGCVPTCAPCTAGANFSSAGYCQPSSALSGPTDTAFYLSGNADEGKSAFAASCSNAAGVTAATGRFGAAGSALAFAAGGFLSTPASSPLLASLPTGTAVGSASAFVKCAAPTIPAWTPSLGTFVKTASLPNIYFVYNAQPTVRYPVATCTGPCAAANACGTFVTISNAAMATLTSASTNFACAVPPSVASVLEWGAASTSSFEMLNKFGLLVGPADTTTASLSPFVNGGAGGAPFLPVCDSNWHHVAIVRTSTAGATSAYVDGVLLASISIPFPTELAFLRSTLLAMDFNIWLDASTLAAGSVSSWPNSANGPSACTAASCYVINAPSPVLGSNTAFPSPLLPVVASVNMPAPASGSVPMAAFDVSTYIVLAQLPSAGSVTSTNTPITGNPTNPALAFPFLFSYAVISTGATSGRILGGTIDNNIFGFWSNQFGCMYSDDTFNGIAAQGFLNGGCTGTVAVNQLYILTIYCSATKLCQMMVNGAVTWTVQMTVGVTSQLSINTPLNSCCGDERRTFQMGDFIASVGRSYTPWQLGALNQYMNLKYGVNAANQPSISGLGYYRTDTMPAAGAGGTMRLGYNGLGGAGGDFYTGAVADARVYTRALAASEVAALYIPPTSFPNAAVSPAPATGVTSYAFSCVAGAYGPSATLSMNADRSWAWAGGVQPNCKLCSPGTYSFASAAACSLCPAGSYGALAGMSSAACSGTCNAGFFCLAGSASASSSPCGSSAVYCPAGATGPLPVPAGNYSTPLALGGTMRSGFAPCPANRQCTNGVLLPAVDLGASCLAIATSLGGASLVDNLASSPFSPNITVITPGWASPSLTWGLASVVANNPASCVMSAYSIGLVPSGPLTAQLTIGATKINPLLCAAGFTATVNVTRNPVGALDASYDSSWGQQQTTCTVAVAVVASLKPPTVTLCQGVSVPERQNTTTKYGTVIAATSSSPTSTIYYFVNASSSYPNAGIPFPCTYNSLRGGVGWKALTISTTTTNSTTHLTL